MLSRPRTLPAGFIQPCLANQGPMPARWHCGCMRLSTKASGSHDQTKAAAVSERAKWARLSSAHALQGRGAGRPGRGPQQRERKAAPRLERLSRMACASGDALHSVRLRMGSAPRRSLPRGTGWAIGSIASAHRRLNSYVAVAAISLSPPARNARSTAAVNSRFIRSSRSVRIGADMITGARSVDPKL